MTARCKRRPEIVHVAIDAGTYTDYELPIETVEYTVRVVQPVSPYAGIAWSLRLAPNLAHPIHFAAGESWQEERIAKLDRPMVLRLHSVLAGQAELFIWREAPGG